MECGVGQPGSPGGRPVSSSGIVFFGIGVGPRDASRPREGSVPNFVGLQLIEQVSVADCQ